MGWGDPLMGRPKRRNRAQRIDSVEALAQQLPDDLKNPNSMEPRDRIPAIGEWLRANGIDPGLALDVLNAAGLGVVEWFRGRLSAPGAAHGHQVYRTQRENHPGLPPREPSRPNLKVVPGRQSAR